MSRLDSAVLITPSGVTEPWKSTSQHHVDLVIFQNPRAFFFFPSYVLFNKPPRTNARLQPDVITSTNKTERRLHANCYYMSVMKLVYFSTCEKLHLI